MPDKAPQRPAPPAFLAQWPVRLSLGLCVAAVLTVRLVVAWGPTTPGNLVYNVPIFVVFGLWLPTTAAWLWQRRWEQFVIAAAVIAVAGVRVGFFGSHVMWQFPASGHATFLAYVLAATRRDRLLLWPAAAAMVEVVVHKAVYGDYSTLLMGAALGGAFGLTARVLARRRETAKPVAED